MKFENTTFANIYSPRNGSPIVADIMANKNLVKIDNHNFWTKKFDIFPTAAPTDAQGNSSFIVKLREQMQGELMSMRAPLSEAAPVDAPAMQTYTGSIPSFAPRGFIENATERWYSMNAFKDDQLTEEDMVRNYAKKLQFFVDSANQTLSFAAARILSTGQLVYDKGYGIKGNVLKAPIPTENFLNAGTAVWTDSTFPLLDHLRTLVETLNNKHGKMAWQLEITRDRFVSTFLNNTQVLDWLKLQYGIQHSVLTANIPNAIATVDYAITALAADSDLPRISIVSEAQNDVELGTVHGWATNIAVLRPMGYAGYIMYARPAEGVVMPSMGARAVTQNFTTAFNGIGLIINSEMDNGKLREWHTDFVMNAVPALDEFVYHYIINTGTAN